MIPRLLIAISCLFLFLSWKIQSSPVSSITRIHDTHPQKDLFDSDKPLDITLKGNIHELLNNRTGEAKYHPIQLSYKEEDSSDVSIAVNIKTRGHFRRIKTNCFYPPLLIQFPDDNNHPSSLFPGKAKLKLVMPCKSDDYVVREWMVYKIYNLITPESFKARLVRVTLENEKEKKNNSPFFGILLEEDHRMAKRNKEVAITRKVSPEMTDAEAFLKMAVFEYLIGNTDWSVEYLQNIKLIALDSMSVPVTVPYDFDHAGIVNAPYAEPAEALQLSSCRERRYRGYCIQDMKVFDSCIACYNRARNDIYNLYINCSLMDEKYKKSTVQYLDEFYKTINNPKTLQKEFGYPCNKNGTGNVIIKGLKED